MNSIQHLALLLFLSLQAGQPQRALITGVSRGIGYALAENLLNRGVSVVGVARTPASQLQQLTSHAQFTYFQADLGSSVGLLAFDIFIHENNYTFDFIIHNAAIINPVYLADANPEDLDRLIAINLLAPMKLTHILAHTYNPHARIAFISSGAATHAIAQLGVYCISKAGLLMLTNMLRTEYAQRDLGIVSIIPGVVDTDMQRLLREQARGDIQAEFQTLYDQGELIAPSQCADYITWLLCDVPFERYKKRVVWDIDEKTGLKSSFWRPRSLFFDNFYHN